MRRDGELPDLLTVEEAAALLRVGRTKAYAMAKEWRATQGRSGLPVLDFGNVLRVPLRRLEAMVGGEFHATSLSSPSGCPRANADERPVPNVPEDDGGPPPQDDARRRASSRRRSKVDQSQLSFLHAYDVTTEDDVNDVSSSCNRASEGH